MKTPVTSFDVARLADVSQSAVSRTFTTGASVSESTRQKVLEAARKLGYQPNAHARSLITGRSRIIGVVMASFANLFYPVALERLAKRLQKDGYHILIFMSDSQNSDNLIGELLQYKVDGIVLGATTLSSALAQRCADASIPVILFNRIMSTDSAGAVSSVRSDNVNGGRAVAKFLAEAGHRRIAFIAGREDSSTNMERERGFREGLADFGLRIFARAIGNYDYEEARQAARELFSPLSDRPDAVFVAGDFMAIAVMDTLRTELGLHVPDDVSVIGFDNVPQAAWDSYQMTTYEQSIDPMIDATVNLLHKYLRGDPMPVGENIVVPGRLVVRTSARQPVNPSTRQRQALLN